MVKSSAFCTIIPFPSNLADRSKLKKLAALLMKQRARIRSAGVHLFVTLGVVRKKLLRLNVSQCNHVLSARSYEGYSMLSPPSALYLPRYEPSKNNYTSLL